MAQVKVYGIPPSSYTWSVRMALAEKGVDYELVESAPNSEAQLKRHPFGKVPAFSHGDVDIFESAAILNYIDAVFDGPSLLPADPAVRAQVLQWMNAATDYLYPTAVKGVVIPRVVVQRQGGKVDEASIASNASKTREYLSIFDKALGQTAFLGSDSFSLADIMLAPIAFYISVVPDTAKAGADLGNFSQWLEKVKSRPSFGATAPRLG